MQDLDKSQQVALIKSLRETTMAGMADCRSALVEAAWDMSKALDLVKARGLAQTSRNASKVASEGVLVLSCNLASDQITALELNCQTDFVARSKEFSDLAELALSAIEFKTDLAQFTGNWDMEYGVEVVKEGSDIRSIGQRCQALMAITKENIVVRRWFREEVMGDNRRVFAYLHNNQKLAVLLSMEAPSAEAAKSEDFLNFGNDVAMQIAAMNPIAISLDQVSQEEKDRQKAIFETQMRESNKPAVQWGKIIEGKFRKWATDSCLLPMESVLVPKTSIETLANLLSKKLCGEEGKVKCLSFQRIEVGAGIEKPAEEDYASEIAKMTGVKVETKGFNSENHAVEMIHNGGEQLEKTMDVFKESN